jgi:hypothetical protein
LSTSEDVEDKELIRKGEGSEFEFISEKAKLGVAGVVVGVGERAKKPNVALAQSRGAARLAPNRIPFPKAGVVPGVLAVDLVSVKTRGDPTPLWSRTLSTNNSFGGILLFVVMLLLLVLPLVLFSLFVLLELVVLVVVVVLVVLPFSLLLFVALLVVLLDLFVSVMSSSVSSSLFSDDSSSSSLFSLEFSLSCSLFDFVPFENISAVASVEFEGEEVGCKRARELSLGLSVLAEERECNKA